MDLLRKPQKRGVIVVIEDPFPHHGSISRFRDTAMALIVKSRRRRSVPMSQGSCTTKPVWPLCVFRSVRASAISVWLLDAKIQENLVRLVGSRVPGRFQESSPLQQNQRLSESVQVTSHERLHPPHRSLNGRDRYLLVGKGV